MIPHHALPASLTPPRLLYPVPHNNKTYVEYVEDHHDGTLPHLDLAIGQKADAKKDGDYEKGDVTHEGFAADAERVDDGHGAGDDGGNEGSGADELTDGEGARIDFHSGEGREDIWGAIAEGEESHSSLWRWS